MNLIVRSSVLAVCLIGALECSGPGSAWAANGTWSETTGDGKWSSGANWSGGVIADGADSTANLSTVDLDALAVNVQYPGFFRNAIEVDTPRTIGNLIFGDSNVATPGGWQVYTLDPVNNTLTLAGAAPTITVNPLGPFDTVPSGGTEVIDDAWFSNVNLSGTSGFTKAGNGVLTLAGTANTLSGTINVNAGTLRLPSTYVNTGATPIVLGNGTKLDVDIAAIGGVSVAAGATATLRAGAGVNTGATPIVLGNGTKLDVDIAAIGGVSVAAGATATLRAGAGVNNFMPNVTGAGVGMGSVLNLELAGTAVRTYTPEQSWAGFDALNVKGTAAGTPPDLRFRPNSTAGFDTNSFATTAVNLDNVRVYWRTSGAGGGNGNDINIGSLSGTATAVLDGGGFTGGATPARYHIGALNTDTVFAGTIQNSGTVAGPDPDTGSILIEKVGSGKLTLSGSLTYTTAALADPVLRGGVTRVTAGTLAVTGTAAIPGGITDDTLGNLYTSIDVRAGASFDVSGASPTYSTAPLQQIVGPGTIVGSYNHDEGRIRAADVLVGNGNIPTPTAGTITFANNLSFAGSGEIIYDMAASPAAGNDLIQVNGTTSLAGTPTVTPNFLAGNTPTTGTYTILNSTGGFTGTPTGWTVAWPGRGAGPTVVANGNLLQFTAVPVVGGANLNWTGVSGTNWDVNATLNWRNNGTNVNDKYFNDDNVTFADTHTGGTPVSNFSVTLVANVAPRSVTVDSANNYTFTGPGVITGTSTFTKRGASTLVMQKTNTFSGAAALEAGTVDVGNFNGGLGTGVLTLKGATITGTMNGLTNSALVVESGNNTIRSNNATFIGLPALSGSGNLTVTSADDNLRVDLAGAVNNFTGNLSFAPDGVTGLAMTVRIAGAANDLPGASVALSNGTVVANRNGSGAVLNIELGALSGDSTTALQPFSGGGTSPGTNWQIGALNATTVFAGVIRDNVNPTTMAITSVSSLTKQGTGTLTLSGPNTYTGNTTVSAGVLSLSTPFLANGADVTLTTGAVLNLNFSDIDVIDSLFINGVSQATGTWGSPTSAATHKSNLFSGSGLLQVSTAIAPPLLIGDYNSNGVVDTADYTVWRNNLGTAAVLNNRDPLNMGNVSQNDYASWKTNFGATLAGAGSLGSQASVPEPSTLLFTFLVLFSMASGAGLRRR